MCRIIPNLPVCLRAAGLWEGVWVFAAHTASDSTPISASLSFTQKQPAGQRGLAFCRVRWCSFHHEPGKRTGNRSFHTLNLLNTVHYLKDILFKLNLWFLARYFIHLIFFFSFRWILFSALNIDVDIVDFNDISAFMYFRNKHLISECFCVFLHTWSGLVYTVLWKKCFCLCISHTKLFQKVKQRQTE